MEKCHPSQDTMGLSREESATAWSAGGLVCLMRVQSSGSLGSGQRDWLFVIGIMNGVIMGNQP